MGFRKKYKEDDESEKQRKEARKLFKKTQNSRAKTRWIRRKLTKRERFDRELAELWLLFIQFVTESSFLTFLMWPRARNPLAQKKFSIPTFFFRMVVSLPRKENCFFFFVYVISLLNLKRLDEF